MELVVEHLSKTYPNGVQALKDVSLRIPLGMYGLLGPNRAGKSTFMRTLATLQQAASSDNIRIGSAIENTHRNAPVVVQTYFAIASILTLLMTTDSRCS